LDSEEGNDPDRGNHPKRRAPPELLTDESPEGDSNDVRDSQACEHERDSTGLLLVINHTRSDYCTNTEEASMTQRSDDASDKHGDIGRSEGRYQITGDE